MFSKLWAWTLSLAGRKSAEVWLAIIAFVESSVFLVPADVLYLPMAIAKPERSYRYALIATIASVAGGIAGWALGYFAFEMVAKPVVAFYGKLDAFEVMLTHVNDWWILVLLMTSGLAHLPPIKIVTILAGVVHMNLFLFITAAALTRGARFFALAFLLHRYGTNIGIFIERRLGKILAVVAIAAAAIYLGFALTEGST